MIYLKNPPGGTIAMKHLSMITAAAFLVMVSASCCMNVETGSTPRRYCLRMPAGPYTMHLHQGAGQYAAIVPDNGIYTVHIPSMNGGYSRCLLVKYNVHDPNEYKVLLIRKSGAVHREYSVRELDLLPEQDGIRDLPL